MNQTEKRRHLIDALLSEQPRYRGMEIPTDEAEQRQLLRGLMNIRLPGAVDNDILRVQDEYLREAITERGITDVDDLTPVEPGIFLWQGDITTLRCDAIVNAANSGMTGCYQPCHSCIDNCIHTYAGIQLRAECHQQMQALRSRYGRNYEQPTALPMLTEGYNLPAKKVVHIVGPIVYDGLTPDLENDLADCYRNTLDLCAENSLRSVAFCSISTGVFRFPKERAAEIAVRTVTEWLAAHPGKMERVIFNVFSDRDRCNYEQKLR